MNLSLISIIKVLLHKSCFYIFLAVAFLLLFFIVYNIIIMYFQHEHFLNKSMPLIILVFSVLNECIVTDDTK